MGEKKKDPLHVVITGASAGIGEGLAREFARHGHKLTLVARRKERMVALAAELGVETHVVAADLSDPERACDFLAGAEAALGPIDVLINNAGVQIVGPTETTDPVRGEELLRLNVATPMRLTIALLPKMLARKSGVIVDVASVAALAQMGGMYYYNAAKSALAAASEGLRGELRGTGVHVVTVYPGPVDTAMAQTALKAYEETTAVRLSPLGTTEELARMVYRAVQRRSPRVIYPRAYATARWFPNISRWATARMTPPMTRPDAAAVAKKQTQPD